MTTVIKSVLEGLSFGEKCKLLGVALRVSGLCVETAAGPGGAAVPTGLPGHALCARGHVAYRPLAGPTADELYARQRQSEEGALAEAAADTVAADAKLAQSL